jgi:hypothetical protein
MGGKYSEVMLSAYLPTVLFIINGSQIGVSNTTFNVVKWMGQ